MSPVTLKERLQNIGQAIRGNKPDPVVKEVVKEVEAKAKSVMGGFLDFAPSKDITTVSSKYLEADKGWVYRNNDLIATEIGAMELELYSVKAVRDEVIFDRIYTHKLLDALNRFNEYTSSSDGFYITQSHKKLTGDSFWYVDRNGVEINEITILQPDKVTIKLGKVEGTRRVIQAYVFKDIIKGEQVEVTYEPEEIVHFRKPNSKNPYRGKSAVEAAAEAIDTDTMAIEANKKLFERGLIAQLMLVTEKSLTPEQLKQLHSEFRNTYGGTQNAYKVPIFSGGIKPENVQMTNKDAQFLEQQEWLRDKICSIFGNPKSLLTTDDVNMANADATILNWKRTTVTSEMKAIVDTLNEFLVPLYGDNLLLGFKDPVEEDESAKIADVKTLKDADIISRNEAREELGREPVEGGNEFDFQRTERRAEQAVQIPPALRHVNMNSVINKQLESVAQYKKIKAMVRPYAEKMVKGKKKQVKRFDAEQVQTYYAKQIAIVETVELALHDRIQSFIKKVADKAIDQVPTEVANAKKKLKKKALLNEEELIVEATLDFTPLLMEVAAQAGTEALNLINSNKPYVPTNIRKVVERRVKMFATSMIETDRDKLTALITEGLSNGQSVPQISQSIRETFETFSKTQTDRIVRTEVLRTSNISAVDAWDQSDEVVGKQWLTAGGADAECEVYEGKIVSLKGNFYPTEEFADGDPPIHPNCRCTILPVLKGEMANTAEVKVKQLEAEIEQLIPKVKEVEDVEKLKEELGKAESEKARLKKKNKKLEEEKQELEGFLDEPQDWAS